MDTIKLWGSRAGAAGWLDAHAEAGGEPRVRPDDPQRQRLANWGRVGRANGCRMNLGLKITWSSAKPSVAYLRLLGALRFHSLPLILPVLPPRPGIAQSGAVGGVE